MSSSNQVVWYPRLLDDDFRLRSDSLRFASDTKLGHSPLLKWPLA